MIMKQIEEEESKKHAAYLSKVIEEVKKDGGVNGTTFWKVRNRLTKKSNENAHIVMNKDGKKCEEPEEIKEAYIEFYKELLTTKEATSKRGSREARV